MHAWEVVHAQEVCMGGMPGRHACQGGQEQHTCMHDWSILADLDLKLDAGCILQPIS